MSSFGRIKQSQLHYPNNNSTKRNGKLLWLIIAIQSLLLLSVSLRQPLLAPLQPSCPSLPKGPGPGPGPKGQDRIWHGGNPSQDRPGSCWCSHDSYCMCTPSTSIDIILTSGPQHVLLVRRKDTNQLANVGGFVQVGETVEDAVRRELLEETGLDIPKMKLWGVYSDPKRDSRRHTMSAVFLVHAPLDAEPRAADDVKDIVRVPLVDIGPEEMGDLFADHLTILLDYKYFLKNGGKHDLAGGALDMVPDDFTRSVCE